MWMAVDPRLLLGCKDVFTNIVLALHQPSSVLSCAVNKQTCEWLRENSIWEALTKAHSLWHTNRGANSWVEGFKRHYKRGFYFTVQNSHSLEPRIDFSFNGFSLRLCVDGVETISLPHICETSSFWLQPFSKAKGWHLNAEEISKALNTSNLDYLIEEELHKHIGQILSEGNYLALFRTGYPHWFAGDDNTNFFVNQHSKGNRYANDHNPIAEFSEGYYQFFWDNPTCYLHLPVVRDDPTFTTEVACGMFEMLIPLQTYSSLDRSRVDYYKREMVDNGLIPTILTVGFYDNRKVLHNPYRDKRFDPPEDIKKFDRLIVVVSFVLDGHHKLAAAAELNLPVRIFNFLNLHMEQRIVSPRPEIIKKLLEDTSKLRLYDTPVTCPVDIDNIPPVKIYWMSVADGIETEVITWVAEELLWCIWTNYQFVWSDEARERSKTEETPLDFFIKHFAAFEDGNEFFCWPRSWRFFRLLMDRNGVAATPESIASGLFRNVPRLPEKESDWWIPKVAPVPTEDPSLAVGGRGGLRDRGCRRGRGRGGRRGRGRGGGVFGPTEELSKWPDPKIVPPFEDRQTEAVPEAVGPEDTPLPQEETETYNESTLSTFYPRGETESNLDFNDNSF